VRVAIVSALRNVARFVPFYRASIEAFTVQPSRIVLYENDSRDGTASRLQQWPGVTWFSLRTHVPHYPKVATAERAAHLAYVRNMAIEHALAYDDWDAALMLDAQKYASPVLLESLLTVLEKSADIVAPLVCIPGGIFYDTWCFRHLNGKPFREIEDGRPHGVLDPGTPFQVGAVGGVYLVHRRVFEAGLRLAGTNGEACDSVPLCTHARARGFTVWVDPRVQALHCPTPQQMRLYVRDRRPKW